MAPGPAARVRRDSDGGGFRSVRRDRDRHRRRDPRGPPLPRAGGTDRAVPTMGEELQARPGHGAGPGRRLPGLGDVRERGDREPPSLPALHPCHRGDPPRLAQSWLEDRGSASPAPVRGVPCAIDRDPGASRHLHRCSPSGGPGHLSASDLQHAGPCPRDRRDGPLLVPQRKGAETPQGRSRGPRTTDAVSGERARLRRGGANPPRQGVRVVRLRKGGCAGRTGGGPDIPSRAGKPETSRRNPSPRPRDPQSLDQTRAGARRSPRRAARPNPGEPSACCSQPDGRPADRRRRAPGGPRSGATRGSRLPHRKASDHAGGTIRLTRSPCTSQRVAPAAGAEIGRDGLPHRDRQPSLFRTGNRTGGRPGEAIQQGPDADHAGHRSLQEPQRHLRPSDG